MSDMTEVSGTTDGGYLEHGTTVPQGAVFDQGLSRMAELPEHIAAVLDGHHEGGEAPDGSAAVRDDRDAYLAERAYAEAEAAFAEAGAYEQLEQRYPLLAHSPAVAQDAIDGAAALAALFCPDDPGAAADPRFMEIAHVATVGVLRARDARQRAEAARPDGERWKDSLRAEKEDRAAFAEANPGKVHPHDMWGWG